MRRYLQPLATTLATLALASLAPQLVPQARAAEGERSFTLSMDPEAILLQVRFSGSAGPAVVYTLYGDGRLVHERVQEAAKHVSEHVEMQLGFLEGQELIRIVVDAGLLECDPDCINKRCASLLGVHRIPQTRDCGGVMLTLNLESYQGPQESTPRRVDSRVYLDCPHALVDYYCSARDLPEAQAYLDLAEALHERKMAAQEAEQ